MRRVFVLITVVFLVGCGKADPDKAQLKKEIDRLRQAKAEAEAGKLALQKEMVAYRADLEHERFRNQELKRELKKLGDLRQIVDIAKRLPKTEPVENKPVVTPPPPAERPQPVPISAAIAVATTVPTVELPKPAPKETKPKPKPEPKVTAAKPKRVPPAKPAKQKTVAERGPRQAPAPPKPHAPKPVVKSKPDPAKKSPPTVPHETAKKIPAAAPKPTPTPTPQPEVLATPRPGGISPPHFSAPSAEELQLVNLVNRREGNKLVLSGQVRNKTSLPAQKVVVTCKLYDKRSSVIRTIRIPVHGGSPVDPGASVKFQTQTPWDGRISGCRFEVEGVQRVDVSRRN